MSRRPSSPAFLILGFALVIALTGGGYAVGASRITSAEIKNGTIKGVDVKKDALTGSVIRESSLGRVPEAATADMATTVSSGSVTGAKVADGSLSAVDFAAVYLPAVTLTIGELDGDACGFQQVVVGGGDLNSAAVVLTPQYQTTTSFTRYQASTTPVANTIVVTACNTKSTPTDEGTVTFSVMVLK